MMEVRGAVSEIVNEIAPRQPLFWRKTRIRVEYRMSSIHFLRLILTEKNKPPKGGRL